MLGKLLKQEFGATARYFSTQRHCQLSCTWYLWLCISHYCDLYRYADPYRNPLLQDNSNLRSIPYLYTSGEDISDRTFQNTGSHSLGNPCRDHSHLFCYRYVLYQWICYLSRDDGWITFLI